MKNIFYSPVLNGAVKTKNIILQDKFSDFFFFLIKLHMTNQIAPFGNKGRTHTGSEFSNDIEIVK